MSRMRTRARKRRAHFEQRVDEFSRARSNLALLHDHLTDLLAFDTPIWPIAEASSRSNPLDDAERAMVAQFVAPHLVSKPPGPVRMRHAVRVEMERRRRDERLQSQVSNFTPSI